MVSWNQVIWLFSLDQETWGKDIVIGAVAVADIKWDFIISCLQRSPTNELFQCTTKSQQEIESFPETKITNFWHFWSVLGDLSCLCNDFPFLFLHCNWFLFYYISVFDTLIK